MNSLAEQVIVDILSREMALPDNAVWIANQNREIPKDDGLYIVVGLSDTRFTSASSDIDDRENGVYEIQEATAQENIQIDILSRSNAALLRRTEILLALRSLYAQQMQEKHRFKIFEIPSTFLNASGAEGGSNINRFSVTIACNVWYRKEKLLSSAGGDYYDDFTHRVDDAKSIETDNGIIEFRITGDTP